MSVRSMSRVWERSRHNGSELLMLLAIADFADDEGRAYPSITTLATKCRTKPRYAIVLLDALSASGELEIRKHAGPVGRGGRTNLYRIVFDKLQGSPHEPVNLCAPVGAVEVVHTHAPVNHGAVVHQGSGSGEPGFREVVNQGAPKPSGTIRTVGRQRSDDSLDSARGTRLASDWVIPDEWLTWAQEHRPGLNIANAAAAFADYWRSVPGAKGKKADWFATWRNWVRRERVDERRPASSTAWEGAQ